MLSCSIPQALGIWTDLMDCYYGRGWGGDTAEIYAYRLYGHNPRLTINADCQLKREAQAEAGQEAANNLTILLRHFSEEQDCRIQVDGRTLGNQKVRPFTHRVHIKVIRKE